MSKYSLRAVESALSLNKGNIPQTRIRWYSLAEHLYSETLIKMLNPETQEPEVIYFNLGLVEVVVSWIVACFERG
jgi:hypothetical protein